MPIFYDRKNLLKSFLLCSTAISNKLTTVSPLACKLITRKGDKELLQHFCQFILLVRECLAIHSVHFFLYMFHDVNHCFSFLNRVLKTNTSVIFFEYSGCTCFTTTDWNGVKCSHHTLEHKMTNSFLVSSILRY